MIGLGSNVDPERNLRAAARMLRELWSGIRFSRVVRSAPIGYVDQDAFLNAVALVSTRLAPARMHGYLKTIEERLKKATPFPQGPRTIDLDLLLVDDMVASVGDLQIPHPRMHERRFVLEPLIELIDPLDTHPILERTWSDLLADVGSQAIEYTDIEL